MDNELLTVREVSDYFKVTPDTVLRWIRRGELDAVKLGQGRNHTYRISKQAVEEFLTAA